MTRDQFETLVNLLNEAFDLPLQWLPGEGASPPSTASVLKFLDLYEQILSEMERDEIYEAASELLAYARVLRLLSDDDFHFSTPIKAEISHESGKLRVVRLTEISGDPLIPGRMLPPSASRKRLLQIYDEFLTSERMILRRAGLNQAAVAVIIDLLSRKRATIVNAIIAERRWNPPKIKSAVLRINKEMETLRRSAVAAPEAKTTFRRIRRFKEHLVAAGVLFADGVPLLFNSSLDVASFASGIAGVSLSAMFAESKPQSPKKGADDRDD